MCPISIVNTSLMKNITAYDYVFVLILLSEDKINSLSSLLPILEEIFESGKRSLLVQGHNTRRILKLIMIVRKKRIKL